MAGEVRWAPKVPRGKIQRLYESDATGLRDSDLLEDVGAGLMARCESILQVSAAHRGLVRCPCCGAEIIRTEWDTELSCRCGWQMAWQDYHRTYRGKQLLGCNAEPIFLAFVRQYPLCRSEDDRMLCIDHLINSFHHALIRERNAMQPEDDLPSDEYGRPVAANLIEGNIKEVIAFLDGLSASPSNEAFRQRIRAVPWAQVFIKE